MRELAPQLVCHGAVWAREIYPLTLAPCHLPGKRADPGVMRADLSLSLTWGNTWENSPCTSPGTVELAPDVGVVGEPARGHEHRRACSVSCFQDMDKVEMPSFPSSSCAIYDRKESCPQSHETERNGQVPHQIQILREADSAPHLSSRVELALVAGDGWRADPEGRRAGEPVY